MPPWQFISDVTGVAVGGLLTTQAFTPPTSTRPGDAQLAIIAMAPQVSHVNLDDNADGWEELASYALTSATIIVARRIAAESDPETLTLKLTAGLTWVLTAMETYRGLDAAAELIEGSGANIAASTNFACPSRALVRYSDLYLGIAVVTSAAAAVAPPAGCTERHEHGAGGRQLEVFDLRTEESGATGVQTATTAGAQSGSVASIALATTGLLGGKSLSNASPIPGMLGLPRRGV